MSPLGKNQIDQKAGQEACGRKMSNHSVRKTSIPCYLMHVFTVDRLSGRNNLQSLSSHKSASVAHQRESRILFAIKFQGPLNSSVRTPAFPVGQSRSPLERSISNQSSFSVQGMPRTIHSSRRCHDRINFKMRV